MKKYFYYFKDTENRPTVTVCLISLKNKVARGIAICSTKDNFSKKTYVDDNGNIVKGGRDIAEERAMTALLDEENSEPIYRSECDDILTNCGFDLEVEYKSEFDPELSEFELKLFKAKKKEVSDSISLFQRELDKLTAKFNSKSEYFHIDRLHNGKDKIDFHVKGYRSDNSEYFLIAYKNYK